MAHARAVACGLAVQRLGLPIAEVARALGISATAVRLGLARAPAPMLAGGVRPEDLVPRLR